LKNSFAWVILLSPFILAVAVFFAVFFYKRLSRNRKCLVPAMVALGLFLLAVALESTIYFLPSFSDWSTGELFKYRLFLAFEESGELFGSTLFLLSFYRYRAYLRAQASGPETAATP
jgi:hypothetical protein